MDRRLSVDLLKLLLAVMVVGIHANPVKPLGHDAVVLTGQGLYRLAVPGFFVINGYFFQPVALAGGTGRYVRRLLGLFALWTALYLPGWIGLFGAGDAATALQVLAVGWWQLWYLPALAVAALLAAAIRNWSVPAQTAAMALGFALGLGLVYGMALGLVTRPDWLRADAAAVYRNGFFMGFPFLMAGALIRRTGFGTQAGAPLLAGLLAVTIAALLAEAVMMDRLLPHGVSHDVMIALVPGAPLLLLLALQFPRQSRSRNLGSYANGIYFLHVAFCILCFRLTELSRPPIWTLAILGSVAVTWAMIRTGLARRLL